jgi:hypothetical protein
MAFDMDGYVDVAERIRQFRAKYPEGSLQPFNPAEPFRICEIGGREFIVYTAVARRHPNDQNPGIAVAAEPVIGKTSYTRDSELMNAETSAWGRCIVAALAADTQKIASLDEVRNRQAEQADSSEHPAAQRREPSKQRREAPKSGEGGSQPTGQISQKQVELLNRLAGERGMAHELLGICSEIADRVIANPTALTKAEASKAITFLMTLPAVEQQAQPAEEPF